MHLSSSFLIGVTGKWNAGIHNGHLEKLETHAPKWDDPQSCLGGNLKLGPSHPKFKTSCASDIIHDQIQCTEHVWCRALRCTQTFWTTVLIVQHTCQVEIWDHPTSRQELWQLQVHTESHICMRLSMKLALCLNHCGKQPHTGFIDGISNDALTSWS